MLRLIKKLRKSKFFNLIKIDNDEFHIKIVARGEGIMYREPNREYNFDIFLGRKPYIIYADEYWDGKLPVQQYSLTEEEKKRIIPRLIAYLREEEPKAKVIVKWKRDPVPLRSSWEIFLEGRRMRGIKD